MQRKAVKTILLTAAVAIMFSGSALALDILPNENRDGPAKQNPKAHLEDAKFKACQNRERAINNILDRVAGRGQKRLDVYDKIAARVQDFYMRKNLSASNYDELVLSMNDKREAAQSAVDGISSKDLDFTCDGINPKGAAASFKDDLKAEIRALHEYQQSIKNLIVAIKTSISQSSQNGDNEEETHQGV
jgi:hypothetical protein